MFHAWLNVNNVSRSGMYHFSVKLEQKRTFNNVEGLGIGGVQVQWGPTQGRGLAANDRVLALGLVARNFDGDQISEDV